MDETPTFSIDDGQLLSDLGQVSPTAPIVFEASALSTDLFRRAQDDLARWACRYPIGVPPATLREWAGSDLNPMTSSREATRTFLGDPDPKRRRAAAHIAIRYWGASNPYFIADLLKVAFQDPDENVRGLALCSLSLLERLVFDRSGQLNMVFSTSPFRRSSIKEVLQRSDERLAKAKEEVRRKWQALAGAYASIMESSQKAAEDLLDHSDAGLRQAAIQVLVREWKVTVLHGGKFEKMLATDPDLSVRCAAAHALAWCYRHTDDGRVGRLLADLVRDDSAPIELRRTAYRSLFTVRQVPREMFMRVFRAPPDAFDWEFVESFRQKE